ncbi:MAG: DUF4834 family protein [Prevotellaceae bacterium]|nr:DUF4834 family protein [Prevotellaceae bacterium]
MLILTFILSFLISFVVIAVAVALYIFLTMRSFLRGGRKRKASRKSQATQPKKKIIADDEGEYVDFEEL